MGAAEDGEARTGGAGGTGHRAVQLQGHSVAVAATATAMVGGTGRKARDWQRPRTDPGPKERAMRPFGG